MNTIIFHHIPKTAGTSFHSVIDENFKEGVYTISGNQIEHELSIQKFIELSVAEKSKIKLLKGHNVFGLHEYFTNKCDYITFVRKPAEKHISGYYYMLKAKAILPERVEFAKKPPSLEDYIKDGDIYYGNNPLVKAFLNIRDPKVLVDEILFKKATKILTDKYTFIGLTEAFDESLVLLDSLYKMNIKGYVKRNVGTNYDRDKLDPNLIDLFNKHNPFDVKFYEFAEKLFWNKISSLGIGFESDLVTFKERNKRFNIKNKAKIKIKKALKRIKPF